MTACASLARIVVPLVMLQLVPGLPAHSQLRASELGSVSQVVNGTRITLEYSRPQVRGRDSLFGRVIPWGETWTPGANWATTLEVDRNIAVEGKPLPAGKYSVWVIPQQTQWTLLLSRSAKLYHIQHPSAADEALRVPIRPEQAAHTEVLTWSFPSVNAEGAVMRMEWGTTAVPIHIGVTPPPATMARGDAEVFTGTYRLTWVIAPAPPPSVLTVTYRDGALRGHIAGGLWGGDPDFDFLPDGSNRFRPLLYRNGKAFDTEDGVFEFSVENDRASEVRLFGIGSLYGKGPRER